MFIMYEGHTLYSKCSVIVSLLKETTNKNVLFSQIVSTSKKSHPCKFLFERGS